MADGGIDCYTTVKMDHIYYTADEELGSLEGRVNRITSRKKCKVSNKVVADSLG